ncbi:zinc finger protein 385B [Cyclopterus lumpus]|uniref:zinc finger protein 385B n=1 Tax=Cyclopterus lumpus TaxID=8103 RepID=UPI001486F6B5|nr:zinc finger protein 385B [Cyclopterus lumpus]
MKTPLSPSQFLERGQTFAFGGMCQELMDPPTPTTISLSVQQTPSPGDRQVPAPMLGQGVAYSLCEVCNLQLASSAQAQLHYNGRSHLRRVRQLQDPPPPPPTLSAPSSSSSICSLCCYCRANQLLRSPGLIGATGPSVMMKPFLTFPVETTSPVGLFPNFNTMDPVQKAVINHTFGVTLVPKKKQVISCNVCQLRFNSDSQAEAHFRGSRHAKKVKSQENKTKAKLSITGETNGSITSPVCPAPPVSASSSANQHTGLFSTSSSSPSSSKASQLPPPPAPVTSSSSAPPPPSQASSQDAPLSVESEEEKAKKLLYCSLCKVAVNSLSQLEAHNAGSKHKTMLEARSGAGPIKAYPRAGTRLKNAGGSALKGSGLQNKTFHCQICDVHVNSEVQLKQHISSRRHKDRVAGKPSKPKYSPYNKQQRSSLTVSLSLSLQKEMVNPSLSSSFLSTPFAPPPCSLTSTMSLPPASLSSPPLLTRTSSPLTQTISLCPRPPTSSSLFTTSFLRPAPGPIRASQGSFLFAPY